MSDAGLTRTRTDCRLCKSNDLAKAIPLAPLPIASPNVGAADLSETAPADVYLCHDCGFLQLNTVVNPEFQYRKFRYVTGLSIGLREHFAALTDGLADRGEIGPGRFMFEIGSNDGSLLALAKARGARVLGIDPAEKLAADATAAGLPTIDDFFTARVAGRIATEHGKADVVISNNTVANIDDLDDVFDGIATMLHPKGMAVIETQYAVDVIEKALLDVIYHEHVSYFAVKPMQIFLAKRNMELFDAERIAPKGGSIRFSIQFKGGGRAISERVAKLIDAETGNDGLMNAAAIEAFNKRVAMLGEQVRDRLAESRRKAGRALAYGSSVGCAALVRYFGLDGYIDAVFDDAPLINYMRSPCRSIPVLSGSQLANEPATDVLVLAWRYAPNIVEKQIAFRAKGGRFYRALPDLGFQD